MTIALRLPDELPAAEIAAAVRAELAVELARLDAAVSTRATPADVDVTVEEPDRFGGVLG